MTTDGLNSDADLLWRWLRTSNAVGAANARRQTDVARETGIAARRIQQCMGELIQAGVPVCSSCVEPMGIFIAHTNEEIEAYIAQLHSRLIGNAARERDLRALLRRRRAVVTEPNGQMQLFVGVPR